MSTIAPASRSVADQPLPLLPGAVLVDRHLRVHPRVDLVQHPEVDRGAHEVPPAPGQPGHQTDRIGTSPLKSLSNRGWWPMASDDASQARRATARRARARGVAALGPAGPRGRPGGHRPGPGPQPGPRGGRRRGRRCVHRPLVLGWPHRAGPVRGRGDRPHGGGGGVRAPDRRLGGVALLLLRASSGCSPSTTTGCRSRRPPARCWSSTASSGCWRPTRSSVSSAATPTPSSSPPCTASTCSRPAPSTSPSGAGTRPCAWRRNGSSTRWTS